MNEEMRLSKEDKDLLTLALEKTKNLPPSQGAVTLNISPERKVSAVEVKFYRK